MIHEFSTLLDDEVLRCEHCGVNILSARGTECQQSLLKYKYQQERKTMEYCEDCGEETYHIDFNNEIMCEPCLLSVD